MQLTSGRCGGDDGGASSMELLANLMCEIAEFDLPYLSVFNKRGLFLPRPAVGGATGPCQRPAAGASQRAAPGLTPSAVGGEARPSSGPDTTQRSSASSGARSGPAEGAAKRAVPTRPPPALTPPSVPAAAVNNAACQVFPTPLLAQTPPIPTPLLAQTPPPPPGAESRRAPLRCAEFCAAFPELGTDTMAEFRGTRASREAFRASCNILLMAKGYTGLTGGKGNAERPDPPPSQASLAAA